MAVLRLISGSGQIVPKGFPTPDPLRVQLVTDAGAPLVGHTISWAIVSGGGSIYPATSITDSGGFAESTFSGNPLLSAAISSEETLINATWGSLSVQFSETTITSTLAGYPAWPTVTVTSPNDNTLSGVANSTVAGAVAVRARWISGASSGSGAAGIAVRVYSDLDPGIHPTVSSATILTAADGTATLDIHYGPIAGGPVRAILDVGGFAQFTLMITVSAAAGPSAVVVSGNFQTGYPSAMLPDPIVVQFYSSPGVEASPGVAVQWAATSDLQIVSSEATTDVSGRASATVRLGSSTGAYSLSATSGGAAASASLWVNNSPNPTGLSIVSGDGQVCNINGTFARFLTVVLLDETGNSVAGASIGWDVLSGDVTISSHTTQTNSAGESSVQLSAGPTSGPVVITATGGGGTVTFALTVVEPTVVPEGGAGGGDDIGGEGPGTGGGQEGPTMAEIDEVIFVNSFDHLDAAHGALKACTYPGNAVVAGRTGNCIANVQFVPHVIAFCRQSTVSIGVAYKSELAGGSGTVMVLGNALSGISVAVNVMADGRLTVYGQASACPCITKDSWYHITLYASHTNTAGNAGTLTVRAYVNEALVYANTFTGLKTLGEEGFTTCSLGGYATGGLPTYFDDIWITKGENLGDLKFYVIRPNAPGDTNEWDAYGAATAWEATKDIVPDDDTTYAYTDTPLARMMVNLEDIIEQGEIRAVQTNVIAKKSEAGTAAIQIGNQFNGVDHLADAEVRPSYQSYLDFRLPYRINPTTLAPFTASDINGMQAIVDRTE